MIIANCSAIRVRDQQQTYIPAQGTPMPNNQAANKRDELQKLLGALDVLTILREEMEQWLEEAQDASKQESLENVVGHVMAMEEEYKHRLRTAEAEDTKA
jgi:hypothetical protein